MQLHNVGAPKKAMGWGKAKPRADGRTADDRPIEYLRVGGLGGCAGLAGLGWADSRTEGKCVWVGWSDCR